MDITKYDKKIRDLYDTYGTYLQMTDPKAMRILNTLLKEAKKQGDDALLGNVYYSLAFTEYFVFGKYDSYLKHLRMAAKQLGLPLALQGKSRYNLENHEGARI